MDWRFEVDITEFGVKSCGDHSCYRLTMLVHNTQKKQTSIKTVLAP